MPPGEDPKLGDPGTTRDDHEQYALDRGEQQRHPERHMAMGAQVADLHLAAVFHDEDQEQREYHGGGHPVTHTAPMRMRSATC